MGLKISTRKRLYSLGLFFFALLSSCAHTPSFDPEKGSTDSAGSPPPTAEFKSEAEQARDQITKLQERVQDLEIRLSALNDKINLENGVANSGTSSTEKLLDKKLPTETVTAPSAHGKIVPPKVDPSAKKPAVKKELHVANESFASNESVDRYREAKILFDSKKYSDAVLEFSEFVKNEPDHALAPAAQYYLGQSYLHQKEYKLAEEEFSRGLLSYAHSSFTPDNLLALAHVSELLKKPTKVTYFKEKILSNFPNSPQAKALSLTTPKTAPIPTKETSEEMSDGEASVIEQPKAPALPTVSGEPSVEGESE